MPQIKITTPDTVDLVLAHGDCFDGFTSMWLAKLVRGDSVECRQVFYGDPAPDVTGRHVAILDFAYGREELERMAEQAESIILLDHHETNYRAHQGAPYVELLVDGVASAPLEIDRSVDDAPPATQFAKFDMRRSGARMTFDWLRDHIPEETRHRADLLSQYVQDRDLWRWALPSSRDVSGAMMALPVTFTAWSSFAARLEFDMGFVLVEGAAANELLQRQSEKIAQTAKIGSIDGHPAWLVMCPYTHASDVGSLLARRPDGPGVAAAWRYDHSKGRLTVSLRSSESGANVALIAEARGGGGHARAAAFELDIPDALGILLST